METFNSFNELVTANENSVVNTGGMDIFNVPVENVTTWNMGRVYTFDDYEIWVYSRNEHLPSHVHIKHGTKDLGKISLYPVVDIVEPETSKIPEGDRAALVESVKLHRKKCQKEWNRLNGKPVPDPRKDGDEE